jgi:cytochrome c-type biogenesis protein
MSVDLIAVGTAAWLGILTSISPCPLASNIAAVSFVGRSVRNPRAAVAAGITYALGRTMTYVSVAVLVVSSVLSIPAVSLFLQHRMNQVLGPLLLLVGAGLLGWLRLPLPSFNWPRSIASDRRDVNIAGAGVLGLVFALSFCPVSAGLFFGALIPLAISHGSRVLLPFTYGIGTGLPVLIFAILIATSAHWVGRAFDILSTIEKWARRVTGGVFVLCGIYLTATHLLRIELL